MPTNSKPLVERAFELAREGLAIGVIRERLKHDGYSAAEISSHLTGRQIIGALRRLAAAAT